MSSPPVNSNATSTSTPVATSTVLTGNPQDDCKEQRDFNFFAASPEQQQQQQQQQQPDPEQQQQSTSQSQQQITSQSQQSLRQQAAALHYLQQSNSDLDINLDFATFDNDNVVNTDNTAAAAAATTATAAAAAAGIHNTDTAGTVDMDTKMQTIYDDHNDDDDDDDDEGLHRPLLSAAEVQPLRTSSTSSQPPQPALLSIRSRKTSGGNAGTAGGTAGTAGGGGLGAGALPGVRRKRKRGRALHRSNSGGRNHNHNDNTDSDNEKVHNHSSHSPTPCLAPCLKTICCNPNLTGSSIKSTLSCMNVMAKVLLWCTTASLSGAVFWYSYELLNHGYVT
jgi:hypothetical protein